MLKEARTFFLKINLSLSGLRWEIRKMSLLRQHYIDRIGVCLSSSPRYKLFILKDDGALLNHDFDLNVGNKLLPILIENRHNKNNLSFIVQESLNSLVQTFTFNDLQLGKFLVFKNIGVLFEPSLAFNVTSFLKGVSKNTITFLIWPGVVSPDSLFFLTESSSYSIKYNEINYFLL